MANPSLLIAISSGGDNDELAEQGIGMDHVEEMSVRLSRRLLSDGHRLAWGGTLGDPNQRLTMRLIDSAHQWVDENAASQVDVTKPDTWPLVNYSAWDLYKSISDEQINKLVGICNFVKIDPPSVAEAELLASLEPGRATRLRSDALTAMRKFSSAQVDLRIVFAGRIRGAKGWMAGILEEVVCSLELDKPIIIIGGFGGCSRLIADYLSDLKALWPEQLNLAASADPVRDATLTVDERDQLNQRMGRARELLNEYRTSLHTKASVSGVSSDELLLVLPSANENAREIINVCASIAKKLCNR
jgi:hypothetical protein